MTIDKVKLKELADAAKQGHWIQDGFYVQDDGIEDYRVAHCRSYADSAFIAAAGPVTVLALLAEIEQLRDSHDQVCSNYNRVSFASEERGKQVDQLKAENEALRSTAMAAREFIMHEAEVRGLLDENGQVSHRHPRRQQAIARIEAALGRGGGHG